MSELQVSRPVQEGRSFVFSPSGILPGFSNPPMKPSPYRHSFRGLALAACFAAPFAACADPLYKWSFDAGVAGTPAITAGGGTLTQNGTADFLGAGVSSNSGDQSLNLSNAYTGGVGAGNSVAAKDANVLTGAGTLSNFTVTMWVKLAPGALSNFPRLLQLGSSATPDSGSNPGINMLVNSGNLEIGVNGRNAQVAAGLSGNTWKFIAFSYDGVSSPTASDTIAVSAKPGAPASARRPNRRSSRVDSIQRTRMYTHEAGAKLTDPGESGNRPATIVRLCHGASNVAGVFCGTPCPSMA